MCTRHIECAAQIFCTNPASKLLVTMDSVSPVMIPSLTHSVINASRSACILFTSRVYASSVTFSASPEFLAAGKSISISYVTNRVSQDCRVWSILNHGLKPVESGHKLVCQTTSPLTVIPSSSEFFVTPKFSFALPYCDKPVIVIVTTSTRPCTESLRGTWGPRSEFPKSFSLIVQSSATAPPTGLG
jgi:hypothetical protein